MCTSHLFAKGFKLMRMKNITECRPQNKISWMALSSIRTPTRAIAAHCQIESNETKSILEKQLSTNPSATIKDCRRTDRPQKAIASDRHQQNESGYG